MKTMNKALLLLTAALSLGGCVAGLAAGAVGAAVRGVRGEPQNNANMEPEAVRACGNRAAPMGTVTIIDIERRTPGKIIVWGTVEDAQQRRSFECAYGTKITGFTLRPVARAK
ncbi:MAG TPA: hypothetical protein VEZ48_14495 [Sphingomonadaceae bacterium]|nr:hypothetical protein [Sphingomonadaceae bacterium]